MQQPYRLGWFSTGRGEGSRNLLRSTLNSIIRGDTKAEISFVFCNRVQGEHEGSNEFMKLVNSYSMPLICISSNKYKQEHPDDWRARFEEEVIQKLEVGEKVKLIDAKKEGEVIQVDNALKKAEIIADFTDKFALADDSGLEVESINGAPGVFSSRFAGEGCSYRDNNVKLLRLLKGVENRRARFRCIMALVAPDGRKETCEGIIEGVISNSIRGDNGFGYDPVFIVPKYNKTFAELGPEIKNKISHRAKALIKMKEIIKRIKKT
jgi:XTP/dITP diphosphohydrolase